MINAKKIEFYFLYNLKMPIKDSLIKSVFRFVFEIEVGFDNISSEVKKSLEDFVKQIEKDEDFYNWTTKEYTNLHEYSDSLKNVCEKIKRGEKIQYNEFNFLNKMIVFNDILKLELFKDENRGTKKDICVVMYNIYKTLQIVKKGLEYNISEEELDELYNKFITKVDKPEPKIVQVPKPNLSLPGNNSILQNLVTDMLGEFQKGELNPMELLQDIMKGPDNITKEGTSINKFTKKYEKRLNDDKVKQEIENQFGSIFKNLNLNKD